MRFLQAGVPSGANPKAVWAPVVFLIALIAKRLYQRTRKCARSPRCVINGRASRPRGACADQRVARARRATPSPASVGMSYRGPLAR